MKNEALSYFLGSELSLTCQVYRIGFHQKNWLLHIYQAALKEFDPDEPKFCVIKHPL